MNFALIIDAIGDDSIKSYYVKNNKTFNLDDDKPSSYTHSINNECCISTYNYPWLFEEGYFLNWSDFKYDLPDIDLEASNFGSNNYYGKIYEVLHFAKTLNAYEISLMETYLSQKYDLTFS